MTQKSLTLDDLKDQYYNSNNIGCIVSSCNSTRYDRQPTSERRLQYDTISCYLPPDKALAPGRQFTPLTSPRRDGRLSWPRPSVRVNAYVLLSILRQSIGSPENAGPDNDGPRKIQSLTLHDLTMTDQIARPDYAGPDIGKLNCVATLLNKL